MQPEGASFVWDNGAHNDAVELFFFWLMKLYWEYLINEFLRHEIVIFAS